MGTESSPRFVFYAKGLEAKSVGNGGEKKYFVKGHIDSEELDLVNDIVTKNCMANIQDQLKSRTIKLDMDHETLRKAKGEDDFDQRLNLTRVPLGKSINSEVDEKGNLVEFELNPNWKKFDAKGNVVQTFQEVWKSVKSGFYDAFSIAYIPIKTAQKEVKGVMARLLEQVNLINVGLTGNAINPTATLNQAMAKSLKWLSDQETKGYEKDGAHAHTEDEPLGIHNHPEIENRIREATEYLSDRISSIYDRIHDMEAPGSKDSEPMIKSKTKGDIPMGEENNEGGAPSGNEPGAEPKATPPTTPPADNSGTEEKSIIDVKAFADMKAKVEKMEEGFNKVMAFMEKAMPAGKGPEDAAKKDKALQSKSGIGITGTMDLI